MNDLKVHYQSSRLVKISDKLDIKNSFLVMTVFWKRISYSMTLPTFCKYLLGIIKVFVIFIN